MKLFILQPSSGKLTSILKQTKEILQTKDSNTVVEIHSDKNIKLVCEDVRKSNADLFLNFNLTGFEQSTLTDGVAYNLLDCKQIHILLDDKLPNEKYLAKQLSISMFFYCLGTDYYKYLLDRYPDIPWLKEINFCQEESKEKAPSANAEILCGIVQEVARICRII